MISAPGTPLAHYLRQLTWAAMLPLLLLVVVLGAVRLEHQRDDETVEGNRLVERLAREVDDVLGDRIKALTLLASSPMLQEDRLADFHRRAQAFKQQFGSELLMADDQGRMLLHTGVDYGSALPPLPRPPGRAAVARHCRRCRGPRGEPRCRWRCPVGSPPWATCSSGPFAARRWWPWPWRCPGAHPTGPC
ncbi:MAG: hypothetical protein JNN18_01845 [Rubrivivax sp.]|nr:hypothetical protein [Rubrivivax sp.]